MLNDSDILKRWIQRENGWVVQLSYERPDGQRVVVRDELETPFIGPQEHPDPPYVVRDERGEMVVMGGGFFL